MKILVAEDDPCLKEFIQSIMDYWGYEADIASNGLEVYQLARKNQYDLCLMDINMPVMDGWEATRRIRRELKYFPIMALTGNPLWDKKICIEAGMDDFLRKPYTPDKLHSKINELTAKSLVLKKTDNEIKITRKMPMDAQHAKELRELAKDGLCKMNLRGVGAHNVSVVVHRNVPFKISQDFVGNEDEISVFLDRSKDKPAECHLYKSSCPMPSIYLTEDEYVSKEEVENELLKTCNAIVTKKTNSD